MFDIIKNILHLVPFVHFYEKWIDVGNYEGYHKQKSYCSVCGKVRNRLEDFGYNGD